MSNIRMSTVLLALTGLLAVILGACNSSSTGSTNVIDIRVAGVLVQEMNDDHAFATARLWRNDTLLSSGTVSLASVPMSFFPSYQEIDSAYQALISPAASHAGSELYFRLGQGNRVTDSILVSVVDTFSITDNIDPANHQLQGAGQVSLEWTAAANTERYILAAVKSDRAYTGTGFSAWVETVGTAGTIPPEAFLDSVGVSPDTGLYNIYVYALSGAPDSLLAEKFLPAPLPQQLADNIDRNDLSGHFGTVAVTLLDTIRVVSSR